MRSRLASAPAATAGERMALPEGRLTCSVVVPVYNGVGVIERCLNALSAQEPRDPHLEIILVDDGSTDDTVAVAERWCAAHPHLRVQVVSQKNAGPAAARNHGVALASGDLLLLTDADCVPAPNWVAAFRAAFESCPAFDAAMGAYLCTQATPAARFAQLEFEERYARMAKQATIDFIATYSAAYRRPVFLEAGGFDVAFPKANNEDVEFSYRLSSRGGRMRFVPAARVQHEHDETWGDYLRTKAGRGYWRTIVYRRFPGKSLKDSYTPQLLKAQMLLALLALAGGAVSIVGRSPRYAIGLLPFLLSTLPMVRFARAQADPALRSVAWWVPWGSFVRAVAFLIGVGKGMLFGSALPTARHAGQIKSASRLHSLHEEPRQ